MEEKAGNGAERCAVAGREKGLCAHGIGNLADTEGRGPYEEKIVRDSVRIVVPDRIRDSMLSYHIGSVE